MSVRTLPRASSNHASGEKETRWYRDAVIYELHIRAFADSNGDGIGDINGLVEKLDYLHDLGVTALWLLPFYPSPLRDGGYDIADYTSINECYGTRRDFARLLKEAHRRGMKVITELVMNHTSVEHPWFQAARNAPPGSPERNFYVWSDAPNRYQDARIIFKDFETSNWAWDPVAKAYYWHRFYSHQPDLNFENPAVREAMFEVVDFWMDMGIDGLRLDAVPYLFEREGTNCENLEETHAFLRELRAHVDSKYRNRMLLAEANQWPADAAAYFGKGDECHMNFHFPLMPRMFMAVELEDSFPIINILKQTPAVPDGCQWATFLRNHDELTLEMVTDEDRDYMYRAYAQETKARVNLGIRRRLAPLMKVRRRIELMNALLFSLPGTPVLYYGDEIGMGDNIYLGDRDGVRTPMQWSADRNAGFSRANPQRLYLPTVVDPEYHYEAINVEAQQSNSSSLLWWMKRIIALRHQFKVFGRGSIEFLHPDNAKVLAFIREHEDEAVLVVANLSRVGQFVELDLGRFSGQYPIELFGRTRFPQIRSTPYLLTLGAHDFFWFQIKKSVSAAAPAAEERPSLVAGGHWTALLAAEQRTALAAALLPYVTRRRWFRGKGRTIKNASVGEALRLTGDGRDHAVVLLDVEYTEGNPERYLVPLSFADGDVAQQATDRSPEAVIASVTLTDIPEGHAANGVLFDAATDPAFAELLLRRLQDKKNVGGADAQLAPVQLKPLKELKPGANLAPKVATTEQSNSAIIYGDQFMLKLYRVVEPGTSCEFEMGVHLGNQDVFPGVAKLAGALEYRTRRSEPSTLATLHTYVANQGDAWAQTLATLDRYFVRLLTAETGPAAPPPVTGNLVERTRMATPPEMASWLGTYLQGAELLGKRCAELHLVLARPTKDPAFQPEPFTIMHQHSLYQSAHGMVGRTFAMLRRSMEQLPESTRALATQVLVEEEALSRMFNAITQRRIEVNRIRCHGDLHLGQVLWTGDDFVIIDFEGEPARPASERRYKRCPLRDVAGMLRSFDYASAYALRRGTLRPEDVPNMEPWARAWTTWVSTAYLREYLATAAGAPMLPSSTADVSLLLNFYQMEKCLYEVSYELNNRPAWVEVPLGGLYRIIKGEH